MQKGKQTHLFSRRKSKQLTRHFLSLTLRFGELIHSLAQWER